MAAERKTAAGKPAARAKQADGGRPAQLERAELIVDDLTQRVRRLAVRAWEEAEDVWAEANKTRRGWRGQKM